MLPVKAHAFIKSVHIFKCFMSEFLNIDKREDFKIQKSIIVTLSNNILLLFNVSSRHCVVRQFDKPASARILYAARDGQLSTAPAVVPQQVENEEWRRRRQSGVFPVREPQSDGILLKFPQVPG